MAIPPKLTQHASGVVDTIPSFNRRATRNNGGGSGHEAFWTLFLSTYAPYCSVSALWFRFTSSGGSRGCRSCPVMRRRSWGGLEERFERQHSFSSSTASTSRRPRAAVVVCRSRAARRRRPPLRRRGAGAATLPALAVFAAALLWESLCWAHRLGGESMLVRFVAWARCHAVRARSKRLRGGRYALQQKQGFDSVLRS